MQLPGLFCCQNYRPATTRDGNGDAARFTAPGGSGLGGHVAGGAAAACQARSVSPHTREVTRSAGDARP